MLSSGTLTVLFIVLHLFFPLSFDWKNDLQHIAPINQGILWIYHTLIIYLFGAWAVLSFLLAGKAVYTVVERVFLLSMAGFYFVRIAFGPVFFEVTPEEILGWLMCLVLALCNIGAVVLDIRVENSRVSKGLPSNVK